MCIGCLCVTHEQAGYIAFSADVREFRSFGVAFVTLFKSLIGGNITPTNNKTNKNATLLAHVCDSITLFVACI
jgi:hypothetical protein